MEQASLHRLSDEDLVLCYRAGNNAALVELVARYIDLSDRKIGRYPHLLKEAEDVKQEALIAFLHAVSRYDANKGASFATYVNFCTDNAIKNFLLHISAKKIQMLKSALPIDQLETIGQGRDNPEEILIHRESFADLEAAIERRLSEFERDVLFCFLDGKTYEQIAENLSSNPKAVDNALQRVRRKLRDCQ